MLLIYFYKISIIKNYYNLYNFIKIVNIIITKSSFSYFEYLFSIKNKLKFIKN